VIRILLMMAMLTMIDPALAAYPPPTIDELRQTKPATALKFERVLDGRSQLHVLLVSYESHGLRLYAFVAVPRGAPSGAGFPVLVANHGTHPNPPRYGFTAQGVDSRPGDYYRSVPELYASRGFMVVMPDYEDTTSPRVASTRTACSRRATTLKTSSRCSGRWIRSSTRTPATSSCGPLAGRRGDAQGAARDRPRQGRFDLVHCRRQHLGPGVLLFSARRRGRFA